MATTTVKTEVIEDTVDANKDTEEQPDFGGDEENQEPTTKTEAAAEALEGQKVEGVAKKEEIDEKAKGEARPDAVHVSGVNRLTRTHLAEIFASKRLPAFQRVEWIADDKCVCVFANKEAALTCLAGALDGFEEGSEKPGPGLWRAIRGMMDFRQATVKDLPSANFKKQHRAGRQVRDYRFWEAAKDIDKNIMDNLEQKGTKRDAPSGEDAIAAAVRADQLEGPRKKRRTMPVETPEAEAPDLLQQMAQKDKELLGLKTEVSEDPPALAETGENEAISAVVDVVPQEKWEDSWFAQQAKHAGRKTREEAWGRHAQADDLQPREDFNDRRAGGGEARQRPPRPERRAPPGARGDEWRHDQFDRPRTTRGWGHDDREAWGREAYSGKRSRGGEGSFQDRGGPSGDGQQGGLVWEADAEERQKRQKRMDRFSKAAPAAATDTAGDGEGQADADR